MQQYLDLCRNVLDNGDYVETRTGVHAWSLPGAMLQFDLRFGFPAVTAKKLFFKPVVGELEGFIKGWDNAAQFREAGCKVWDANANEDGVVPNSWLTNPNRKGVDDLGRIYGQQWRKWRGKPIIKEAVPVMRDSENTYFNALVDFENIDQLALALKAVSETPISRRIIVSAWRPDELDQMALPPCHVLFHLLARPKDRVLHLTMFQRSADCFLGIPFNIASYALLLNLIARATGYHAGILTMMLSDCHIYEAHLDQTREMLSRTPKKQPYLYVPRQTEPQPTVEWLESLDYRQIELVNYDSHPSIYAPMMI